MANKLDDGESRIGNLYDGDPSTPQPRAVLERRKGQVTLKISWDEGETKVYERWFSAGIEYSDDPDQTNYRYDVPDELLFMDTSGPVHLVGCRMVTASHSFGANGGFGVIAARYVVFDGFASAASFATIHGLRSTVTGLRQWTGISSIRFDFRGENGERLERPTWVAKPPAAIQLAPELRLVPAWQSERVGDQVILSEKLSVETVFEDPQEWVDHEAIHRRVRDLLVISQWRREQISDLYARRVEDERGSDATWSPVLHDRPVEAPKTQQFRSDLVEFNDLGVEGLRRWLEIRETFARAIEPLVASVYMEQATIETAISQIGIGLEALGYLIAIHDGGKSPNRAGNLKYTDRFNLIGAPVADAVSFDIETWAKATAVAYNSVKHAELDLPEIRELVRVWRQSTLVFRCWTATRLGIEQQVLKKRIEQYQIAQD